MNTCRLFRQSAAAANWLLHAILIAWLIAPGPPRLGADADVPMTFQLPLTRLGSNGFTLHQWDPIQNAWASSPLTSLSMTNLADDGNGGWYPTTDSYLSASGTIHLFGNDNQPTDWFISDDSWLDTTPLSLAGTASFDRTSFLTTPWFNGESLSSTFFVLLPASRFGASFSLLTDGVSYPLSSSPSVPCYRTDDPANPLVQYGFFEAWGSTRPARSYFVTDGYSIAGPFSPAQHDLTAVNWNYYNPTTTVAITFLLPEGEMGHTFRLHTAAGSVTWIYPNHLWHGTGNWQQVYHPDGDYWESVEDGYYTTEATGTVGTYQDYWLVRECDGATYTGMAVGESITADWTWLPAYTPPTDPPPTDPPPTDPPPTDPPPTDPPPTDPPPTDPPPTDPPPNTGPNPGDTQPLNLNIAASRWSHHFVIVSAYDWSSVEVQADQMQGFWTSDQTGQSWWTSYYYFNATSSYRYGGDWYVLDTTTNEAAPWNTNDLSTWAAADANDDNDGDGLVNWYETLIGTDPNNADSDGDGMSDGWEIAHGLNPRANDGNGDPDGDGISNYEYAAGTDPYAWNVNPRWLALMPVSASAAQVGATYAIEVSWTLAAPVDPWACPGLVDTRRSGK